jgi:hypothetical protein
MDKTDARLGVVEHTLGAVGAYRQDGAEGMLVYGVEGLLDEGQSAFGRSAASAYHVFRTGRAITSTGTGVAGLAFTVGTMFGDRINEWEFGGKKVEDHVTDFYFNNTYGRIVDQRFSDITSDDAIERHRQKLREQRAAQFQTLSRTNEAATASRAPASAYQPPSSDQGRLASDMMLILTPALISARQAQQQSAPAPQVPFAQPPSTGRTTQSGYPYDTRGYNDGRRLETGSTSSSSDPGRSYSGGVSACAPCHGCGCK